MSRVSINGFLKPIDNGAVDDEYLGHFLKVSYIQEISGNSIYSKDRIDVERNGAFRFFLPKKELLGGESVTIAVFAPDGEQLGTQIYSFGNLNVATLSENTEDDTQPLILHVDPKVIQFNESSPVPDAYQKVVGKVIDISGEQKADGVQIAIMATDDPNAAVDSQSYQPIFSAQTDRKGYFFGRVDNKTHELAYGLIAGLKDAPIPIVLDNKKIPKDLILVADLSELPDEAASSGETPKLPDSDDLVRNPSFSQDIGGKCIDFTIPNRTLEEFSFYHTVRTTEPEIKGLTITAKESKDIKAELQTTYDELISFVDRLNNSLRTLSFIEYTVDVEKTTESQALSQPTKMDNVVPSSPVYYLKVTSGNTHLKLSTQDLLQVNQGINFSYLIKMLAEQERRKAKLQELHQQLAAAYCGKYGVQESKIYCETLMSKDALDRDTLESILGHILEYESFVEKNIKLAKQFKDVVSDFSELMQQHFVDSGLIAVMKKRVVKLIQNVDTTTNESQNQEELLGYLRRLVTELAQAEEKDSYNFEPCPPIAKTETMGILCMMQQFKDTMDTLRNKAIFSLGEILMIRANYDAFIASITTFLNLLEQFHSFYTSSAAFMVSLEDNYFIEHYNPIKSSLNTLKRHIYTAINKIENTERAYIYNHPGRKELTVENSIDWDETPTIYENTTIAHGHILHFKQKWKADGYSLGDLLYSLPLAPCQEKQIAIVDWDRKEHAARSEAQTVTETLKADISRDRDISEIINSSFWENINASSTNKTSSTSAGIGGALGFISSGFGLGIAGGVSHSAASSISTATQNSGRNLSGSTLNRLQDNIAQSASSLRSQRSTVIQTVGQTETMTVQTEVIKNNNHCHAMTVEYFEVLKHYAIEQELVDVQECLFVPLPMSLFDDQKILRWRNTLRRAVYGQKLIRGFDAIERIENKYADSDLPIGSYADEVIEDFSGNFSISFELERPYISTIDEATKTEKYDLSKAFPWYWGFLVFKQEVPLTEAEKDTIFETQYAPDIVRTFIDKIEVHAIAEDGTEVPLDLDFTLLSNYRHRVPLKVSVASRTTQNITRRQIKHLRFRANTTVKSSSKIILRSAYLYYRTKHLNESIVRNSRVNNDIINTVEVVIPIIGVQVKTDAALMYTPLSKKELRNPRKEDIEAAAALVSFLDEHLEMAHKVIWSSMDASRLFGLLDGYIAPNSGGKSVASVVENKIMGIVGNNLVLKVVPGERLDPVFKDVEDLVTYYQPTMKPDPFRISVPTKGVYAESIMGKCNSCEEIDDSRHWRFAEAPCDAKPTGIESVSTSSRSLDVGNLQVKDLPSSIIAMQTAPAAPDPTGLGAAFNLLGKSDVFKDMTGLAGTQANALKALQTTSQSVTDLASIGAESMTSLANVGADLQKHTAMKKDIGRTMKAIKEAKTDGHISEEQSKKLAYSALSSMVGEPTKKEVKKATNEEVKELANTAGKNEAAIKVSRPGEIVEVDARKTTKEDTLKPRIILTDQTSSADHRAFKPSLNDKSLIIEVGAHFKDAPEGSHLRWSADPSALKIDNPKVPITRVRGIKPGKQTLVIELFDSGGNQIASERIQLSVPQCVTVTENKALFDAALASIKLTGQKKNVVNEMKKVVEHLLSKANVRVFWKVDIISENIPNHVPAKNVIIATIKNTDINGRLGVTSSSTNADTFNETIEVYPGMYDEPDAIDVDTETQALIIQLETDLPGNSNLIPVATKVYGRLIGETLSHEIGHALLWDDIPGSGHNSPAIANDLMNKGVDRPFKQRTGMENTAQQSPVKPEHYKDNGIATISKFKLSNQGLIDNQWPVPPAFS
ncbi:hypothetical protein V7O66_04895 [Methanolobus sp. ZRKC3]|uniref:hypothetical protein n=1 Tax=Methanolobus sp. ZRKC3 TaxID=3125786 RepID=UPI00324B48DA